MNCNFGIRNEHILVPIFYSKGCRICVAAFYISLYFFKIEFNRRYSIFGISFFDIFVTKIEIHGKIQYILEFIVKI